MFGLRWKQKQLGLHGDELKTICPAVQLELRYQERLTARRIAGKGLENSKTIQQKRGVLTPVE